MIQLCVMGSFRSSIQVSSTAPELALRDTNSFTSVTKKIDSRPLHPLLSHPRSLFAPSTIVKQPASANLKSSLFSRGILTLNMEIVDADNSFMQLAIEEARAAALAGEVPIGALIVHEGKILARSGNRTIRDCDPTAHAEIIVIREAARLLRNYRMAGTTLYVTLEPCSMCAGAIIQGRIPRLVYGADDPKGGAARSCFEVLTNSALNHQVGITSGVLAPDCASLLQSFFAARR
jgi:tRNA(adenine34) deaminase